MFFQFYLIRLQIQNDNANTAKMLKALLIKMHLYFPILIS